MPSLTAAGRRLDYRLIAAADQAAPTLVLLHEGLGALALWRDFPDRLARRTGSPVLVYSRYGHGRSEPLAAPRRADYMHHEAIDALPELLDRLDIRDPVLIGHSDGASIALIHAGVGRRPVRALVLLAPHVFVEERTLAGIAAAREAYLSGDLKPRLARHHDDPDATFFGWNNIWLAPEFRAWNIERYLPAIASPLLLIQGEDDPYGTAAQLAAIRHGVASTHIEELILPACGHAPQREQPGAVLDAIADFVTSL